MSHQFHYPLSGDKAFDLYQSDDPFPLHGFLEEWKNGTHPLDVGYVLAVVGAYNRMIFHGTDGRYRKIR